MQTNKNLPHWLQVGLGAVTLFIAYKVFKKDEQQARAGMIQRAGAIYDLSYTPERFKQLADDFYGLVKYGPANKPALIELLNKLNTNADINALINSYGTRVNYFYANPTGPRDLVQNIKENLNPNEIDTLNNNWSKKNITYKI